MLSADGQTLDTATLGQQLKAIWPTFTAGQLGSKTLTKLSEEVLGRALATGGPTPAGPHAAGSACSTVNEASTLSIEAYGTVIKEVLSDPEAQQQLAKADHGPGIVMGMAQCILKQFAPTARTPTPGSQS